MNDLTDKQLEWLRAHAVSCTVSEFQSVLFELQRHRAAIAADKERVRSVMRTLLIESDSWSRVDGFVERFVGHVADQLAHPTPADADMDREICEAAKRLVDATHAAADAFSQGVVSENGLFMLANSARHKALADAVADAGVALARAVDQRAGRSSVAAAPGPETCTGREPSTPDP